MHRWPCRSIGRHHSTTACLNLSLLPRCFARHMVGDKRIANLEVTFDAHRVRSDFWESLRGDFPISGERAEKLREKGLGTVYMIEGRLYILLEGDC